MSTPASGKSSKSGKAAEKPKKGGKQDDTHEVKHDEKHVDRHHKPYEEIGVLFNGNEVGL